MLRNAGFVPPELECSRAIGELERLVERPGEGAQHTLAAKKLRLLRLRLNGSGQPSAAPAGAGGYLDRILDRLG